MAKSIYFDYNPIFSHNSDIIIITALRGVGKSYGAKIKCLNAFLKNKRTFVWARRTAEQLELTKNTFMDDIKANDKNGLYKNFYVVGNFLYYKETETREIKHKDGTIEEIEEIKKIYKVGLFISFNVGGNARGLAQDFESVKYFIYDEFIEEDNTKYLKDELQKFSSVMTSCLRLADAKIILLSNSLTSANLYFKLFNVKITNKNINSWFVNIPVETDTGQKILKLKIAFQYGADNPIYKEKVLNSIAGKISMLCNYGQMSIQDKFIKDDYTKIIEPKNLKIDFKYNLYYDKITMGIYQTKNNITYIYKPNKIGTTYILNDIQEAAKNNDSILINKKHVIIKILYSQFTNGFMAFCDIHTQQWFINLLNDNF